MSCLVNNQVKDLFDQPLNYLKFFKQTRVEGFVEFEHLLFSILNKEHQEHNWFFAREVQ